LINQDLNKQKNIFCLNLCTGDVYSNKHWREYYDVEAEVTLKSGKTRLNAFQAGSIAGCLVDTERGSISFFKDGKDLGVAFS